MSTLNQFLTSFVQASGPVPDFVTLTMHHQWAYNGFLLLITLGCDILTYSLYKHPKWWGDTRVMAIGDRPGLMLGLGVIIMISLFSYFMIGFHFAQMWYDPRYWYVNWLLS